MTSLTTAIGSRALNRTRGLRRTAGPLELTLAKAACKVSTGRTRGVSLRLSPRAVELLRRRRGEHLSVNATLASVSATKTTSRLMLSVKPRA